ncbi:MULTISPECIES: hypothetical protein [Pectobacterium]|uniref:hypothetical protein n=1 Tax=Pectobacterium TaxID=122277 RepID=UPI0018DF5F0F|nr:hypothetical protein [Pectobacterium parmentieri]MBI0552119.1 hypothetical protein [Pectobacterium parmentieri]MBI0561205.1 hypothetical protein [Pectobacterium parmentieri]MBI0565410.1 hypothetical protein [Pectobacterium parmentieri]
MVSKYRLTVNFSSKLILDTINEIAELSPSKSRSKVIEELIEFRFFDAEKSDSTQKVVNHAKHMQDKNKVADERYKAALKKPGFKNGIAFNGGFGDIDSQLTHVVLPRWKVDLFESSKINHNLDIERVVRNKVKEDILSKPFSEWEHNHFGSIVLSDADLLLVFIDKIDIEVYKMSEGDIEFKNAREINLFVHYKKNDIYGIPFTFGKNPPKEHYNEMIKYLDFNCIRYKTFSDYAKNGWNRSKHSHLIYIENASKSTRGGFFIGCLYNKNNMFKKNETESRNFPPQEVKVFFAHDFLHVKKIKTLSDDFLSHANGKTFLRELGKINKKFEKNSNQ